MSVVRTMRTVDVSPTPSPPNPPLEGEGFRATRAARPCQLRLVHGWSLAGAAALLMLCAPAAHADAVLEYSGGDAQCHADFTRVAIHGLSLRIDSAPPSQDISMVYDAAEKVGVALDHQRKQFFEMEYDDDAIDFQSDVMKSTSHMVDRKTEQVMAQLPKDSSAGGRNSNAMGAASTLPQMDPKAMEQMMQQSLQNMPKEQRAQMEAAMKNLRTSGYFASQTEPVIEATGETRKIGALGCTLERVSQDGALLREDCRTTLDALGLDPGDLKRLQRAIARMQKFANAITDNLHIVGGVKRDHADPEHLLVERRCFEQGKAIGDVTLAIRQQTAPADWFVTPPGYSRMDMGMHGR